MEDRRPPSQVLAQRSIVDIDKIVSALDEEDREAFYRLFQVAVSVGHLVPPPHMHRWIERYFGSLEAVLNQKVVKIANQLTLESTLFNELRAKRPLEARIPAQLAEEI